MKGIIEEIDQNEKMRELTSSEGRAGENVMRQCMGVKRGEKVLVVTDSGLRDVEAAIFFESAKKFTDDVQLVEMEMRTEHAQEPPEKVAKMMAEADVAFLVTTFSLSHTQARKKACKEGARVASMPTITRDTILRTLVIDYGEVAKLSKKIAKSLTKGKEVIVKSGGGTNLKVSVDGRKAITDTGLYTKSGDSGNLPAGEAFVAPVEGKSEGVIVFDGCFADIVLDEPIEVEVSKGKAVNIKGGKAAEVLKEKIEKVGKLAFNIAELGIGTNKKAELGDNLLEVEKVYGTCHVALGNNATFGGKVKVPFHSDGVILKPEVVVDGRVILKGGEFVGRL